MASKSRGLASIADVGGIAANSVDLADCSWYSSTTGDIGALKLPRGITAERPTTNTGGRENFTFNLKVTSNVLESDPAFLQNEPWLWTWAANYNRTNPATDVTDTSSLVLYKGSKYTFINHAIGHGLWLRHTEKTNSSDADSVYALTADDGIISGTQGAKATDTSTPVSIVFEIPTNYSYSQVVIQHSQTGMANVITVSDPPAETLGYLRLNTDPSATNMELYTGTGWKTIPFSDEAGGVNPHPTGTLTTDNWGVITDTNVTTDNWGVITDTNVTTENWEELLLTAFLAAGQLSINNNALVVHDGATGGGIPMLKADMSNVSDGRVASTTIMRKTTSQTLTSTQIVGASTSRIAFPTSVISGITGIAFEDSDKKIRFQKDLTAAWLKFSLRFDPSANCTVELWKNGSKIADADFNAQANFTNTFFYLEQAAFNDYFEIRCYNSSGSNITINNNEIMTIEFLGS